MGRYVYVLSTEPPQGPREACVLHGVYASAGQARRALGEAGECIEDFQLDRVQLDGRLFEGVVQTGLGACHCSRHVRHSSAAPD